MNRFTTRRTLVFLIAISLMKYIFVENKCLVILLNVNIC